MASAALSFPKTKIHEEWIIHDKKAFSEAISPINPDKFISSLNEEGIEIKIIESSFTNCPPEILDKTTKTL